MRKQLSYIHNPGKIPLKALTIGKLLEQTVKTHGDVPAIISKYQNQSLSFSEALNQADTLAAGLRATGINAGDRVAILAPNSVEWYITLIACARGGYILVSIRPKYTFYLIKFDLIYL